jgi:regulator of sigma E protease
MSFWLFTGFLSIALAFMNLLPIPGLDGGYVIFLIWELVTRRKVSEKIMERAGTSFLSASNDEIQFLDLFSFALKYHLSISMPVTQGTRERY